MAWERGQRYRAKLVPGQLQVERIESTGTLSANGLFEVTGPGPQLGQRIRWRGWLNTETNAAETIAELRAMGWRGGKLGNWEGAGSKEFEFSLMIDDGDKPNQKYYRAAFVRPPQAVNEEKAVASSELDALNARLGGLLSSNGTSRGPVPAPPDAPESEGTQEIPF